MLKALHGRLQAVKNTDTIRCLFIHTRSVSTNTAIARGVRRGRSVLPSRGPPSVSRWKEAKPGRTQDQYGEPGFNGVRPRSTSGWIRRPNHQQKQDAEDVELSLASKKERLSPKQQRYLRGGSRDTKPVEASGKFSFSRRPVRDNDLRQNDSPDWTALADRGSRLSSPEAQLRSDRRIGQSGAKTTPYRNTEDRRDRFRTKDESYDASSSRVQDRHPEQYGSTKEPIDRTHPKLSRHPLYSAQNHDESRPRPSNRKERRAAEYGHMENNDTVSKGTDDISEYKTDMVSDLPAKNPAQLYNQQQITLQKHTPLSIPYTTPASEFLYGTSVVLAALRSPRRKLYKLYIYQGEHRAGDNQDEKVKKFALARGVEVFRVKNDWLSLLDKMSAGRPHNGYVLEASPLPKLPATSLLPVKGRNCPLTVALDHQPREEEAINGTDPVIKYHPAFSRYPLVLMLDGILDPGNLGAIIRTAYFLGVDALALSARHSAPLSPVALKASAGASESLPLIQVQTPAAFVDACRSNGWKFYATLAPTGAVTGVATNTATDTVGNDNAEAPQTLNVPHHSLSSLAATCPTHSHPCVLMLGSEGEGLRWALRRKADSTVSIDASRRHPENRASDVDSLNVSVAAGLLCEAFLRAPVDPEARVRPT
ncbi:hypothetical protein MMC13_003809 [Lambiella insularis]|nr:hypothetical protein [Lambiella insularis]